MRKIIGVGILLIAMVSIAAVTSIVTPPGGENTEVQYNNNRRFDGDPDFTFNGTTVTVTGLAATTFSSSAGVFSGAISAATLDTGQGANELYGMDQNVQTTNTVTFATVDTGQGANELYDMNQNVQTGDSVTFGGITDSALTSGRVATVGTSGVLQDDSDLTFSGSRLTATDLTAGSVTDSGLTSGRVPIASTAGLLADDSDMTFSGSRLTVTDLTAGSVTDSGLTSGRVPVAGTAGLLGDFSSFTMNGTTLAFTGPATFATSSGNIGVGTASPGYKIDVQASGTNVENIQILNTNGDSGTMTSAGMVFKVTNSAGTTSAKIAGTEDSVDSAPCDLAFYTSATTGGTPGERMRITGAGKVLIGTTNVTTGMLNAVAADDGTVALLKINAAQASVTTSDIFAGFYSTTGLEGSIAGTGVAGVIAFNTFTASHWTSVAVVTSTQQAADLLLAPVCSLGTAVVPGPRVPGTVRPSRKDQLVATEPCATRYSKAVYGFYAGRDLSTGYDAALALGTGFAIVKNDGKDVDIGDWLATAGDGLTVTLQCSGGTSGAGCVKDDVQRNFSAAKALQPIIWEVGELRRRIAVTYHAG